MFNNQKVTYIILISSLFINNGAIVLSQDFYFSDFQHNLIYYNPAYAGIKTITEVSATYRNQWPGLSNAFITYGTSYIQPLDVLHGGVAVKVTNDDLGGGTIRNTAINAIYSYYIDVNRDFKISAGLQTTYNFKNFSPGNLIFESDFSNSNGATIPTENLAAYSRKYLDFGVGFMGTYSDRYTFGFAVHHLMQPKESFSMTNDDILHRKYTVHFSAEIPLVSAYQIEGPRLNPGIIFEQQYVYQHLTYGSNLNFNPIFCGIWLRQNLSFNFDALIFLLGISQTNYTFAYTYDVNLSGGKFFSPKMGAHEVTFLLHFQYKSKRKKMRAIKCPKF